LAFGSSVAGGAGWGSEAVPVADEVSAITELAEVEGETVGLGVAVSVLTVVSFVAAGAGRKPEMSSSPGAGIGLERVAGAVLRVAAGVEFRAGTALACWAWWSNTSARWSAASSNGVRVTAVAATAGGGVVSASLEAGAAAALAFAGEAETVAELGDADAGAAADAESAAGAFAGVADGWPDVVAAADAGGVGVRNAEATTGRGPGWSEVGLAGSAGLAGAPPG
jgi:hypothetical protein